MLPLQRMGGAALFEIGEVFASSKPSMLCPRSIHRAKTTAPRKILARTRAFLAHFAHAESLMMRVFVAVKRGACVPSNTQGPCLCAQVLSTSVYCGLAETFAHTQGSEWSALR